jgi:hypothetical protein
MGISHEDTKRAEWTLKKFAISWSTARSNLTHSFVINFGTAMFKDGIRRLLNDRTSSVSSRLRANKVGIYD